MEGMRVKVGSDGSGSGSEEIAESGKHMFLK